MPIHAGILQMPPFLDTGTIKSLFDEYVNSPYSVKYTEIPVCLFES